MAKIFLGQPCYGQIEIESCDAVDKATENDAHEIAIMRLSSSLLANCFNVLLGHCLEAGDFEYFCLLHADVAPAEGWLDTLIHELETYGLDAIHAPCAMKRPQGGTSTAVAYSDDPWQPVRRLSMAELHKLWPTFTIKTIREQLDPSAKILLPNTGCLLFKIGDWLERFPGFEIRDRLVRSFDGWQAWNVSEDWNFGYWAASAGVRVGATTKVKTRHIGRAVFLTEKVWGQERDETFFELTGHVPGAA